MKSFLTYTLTSFLSDALHIGDYVYLHHLEFDGMLSSEGIISEDVHLNNSGKTMVNCLFCIHLQVK